MRTLVRIDEGWPRRCREEARRVLEERGPSFDGSAEALAEVLERVRPLGRFALPALRDAVRDDRVPVSLLGFEVLLRLPFDTSLEDLVAAGRRHGRMEQVLDAIERAGSPRSVSWLVELSREGAPLRRRALEVLAAIPGRDALDALADLAVNADEDRAPDPDAVAAIASRTGPESLRILLDLYRTSGGDPVLELALRSRAKEARSWVRRTLAGPPSGELDVAIELAGVLEDRGTVASLLGLLHEDRWRREAIRSLFRIGDPRSLPDVLARLDPEGEDARSMTAAARSIGPATLAALAEHAVRKKGATGRNATILLGHVGPRGIPHLAAVLRSGNHAEEASSALARLDTEPSREVLAEGLADPLRGDRLLEMLIDRGHGELAIALLRTLVEEGGGSRTRHALARLERARGSPPPAAPE
jgi:HEAT repeat protein